jgi:hypothetical protein
MTLSLQPRGDISSGRELSKLWLGRGGGRRLGLDGVKGPALERNGLAGGRPVGQPHSGQAARSQILKKAFEAVRDMFIH